MRTGSGDERLQGETSGNATAAVDGELASTGRASVR